MNDGQRLCPECGASHQILEGEAIWPVGWSCRQCGFEVETRDGIPMFAPALAGEMVGMDPAGFSKLAAVEDGNFWFEPRNRLLVSLLMRFFAEASDYLEIGCGSGFVLRGMEHAKPWRAVAASELHPQGLAFARQRLGTRAQFAQMDARQIPAEGAFDVIGAFDVLEHIEEDVMVLQAMRRALRASGGLILAVPQHPWLWSAADDIALHVRRYRRGELESKVSDAGFNILFSGSYTAALLPLMAASRLLNRGGGDREKSRGVELEMPGALNWLMRAALQAEVSLSLAGVRFAVGGSRVVVASKADR
jgi:SAM-dependent methyltransferase